MCLFIPQCLRLVTHGLSKTGASDQPLTNPLEFNANTDIIYACARTHGPTHSHPITQSVSFPQHVLVFNLYGQIISKCLSLAHTKETKHLGSLLVNQEKNGNPKRFFSENDASYEINARVHSAGQDHIHESHIDKCTLVRTLTHKQLHAHFEERPHQLICQLSLHGSCTYWEVYLGCKLAVCCHCCGSRIHLWACALAVLHGRLHLISPFSRFGLALNYAAKKYETQP